jgi:peptidylprolyl isomerase
VSDDQTPGTEAESAESAGEAALTVRGGSGESGQLPSDRVRCDAVELAESADGDVDARRRRMQSLAGGLAGIVVVALVIVGYLVFGGSGNTGGSDNAGGRAGATASAAAAGQGAAGGSTDAGGAGTQALPPGVDPALATEPRVTAGTGNLTELVVTTLIQGTGPAVNAGQNITVNYIGVTYRDGQKFDASWDRGQPASFPIGVGSVIPGWDRGLVGVKVGSRVQLDIPANLAYGDNPTNGSPGGPLRFVVDLLAAQ